MNALLLIPSKYELKLCPSVKRYERYNEFLYRFFFSGEISVLVGITGIGKLNVAKFFDELEEMNSLYHLATHDTININMFNDVYQFWIYTLLFPLADFF